MNDRGCDSVIVQDDSPGERQLQTAAQVDEAPFSAPKREMLELRRASHNFRGPPVDIEVEFGQHIMLAHEIPQFFLHTVDFVESDALGRDIELTVRRPFGGGCLGLLLW